MENHVCRAPSVQWSSESILLWERMTKPESICLHCIQAENKGIFLALVVYKQVVKSQMTPFKPYPKRAGTALVVFKGL